MEFRDKPMQNLIRIKEKDICIELQLMTIFGDIFR